jgi:acyl carrier protein
MFERVRQVVADQLGIEQRYVTLAASFIDDLQADSLDMAELLICFEEAFDCVISEITAESIVSVQDVVDYIELQARA